MIDSMLSFAIRQRWLVMIGVLAMAAFGAWNFTVKAELAKGAPDND